VSLSPSVPAVEAVGLEKTYGRGARAVAALRGLSFRVESGESVALLGANGSGKSTTLKVVLGLLAPTKGTASVLGGPAGRREARAATGYVPEESRRLPALTGREVVRLFAAVQGVRPRGERHRRADEALAACGLSPADARRRVEGYSRGMTRRLALAAAWAPRPRLLVLDEPTSGLDPLGVEEILSLLARHRREGGSILLSTHDRVTAVGACDRAVVLAEGSARLSGPLPALLEGDASPSLAPLLRRAAGG
jgi:ABC-type multidrug transport system ATPase subunit